MMDPESGDMRMLSLEEKIAFEAPNAPDAFPGRVLWREGEEVEVRGCWFRVAAVRRTRVTLIPIPRPKP